MAVDTSKLAEPPTTECPSCRVPLMISKFEKMCPYCGYRDRGCRTCG